MVTLTLNGKEVQFDGDPSMPLLWFIRDVEGLTGTKFGCGVAQCGACTVHVNGEPRRSCVTPVGTLDGAEVTTIEGAAGQGQPRRCRPRGSPSTCRSAATASRARSCRPSVCCRMNPKPTRRRHRSRHDRQHLPLLHLSPHPRRHPRCSQPVGGLSHGTSAIAANRRQFLQGSTAQAWSIGFHVPGAKRAAAAPGGDRVRAERLHAHRARQHRHGDLQAHRVRPGAVHRHRHHPRRRARRRLGADAVESAPADAKQVHQHRLRPVQGTGGSTAMANSWDQLRTAGAEARARLIAAAAEQWGVDAGPDHHREGRRQRAGRQVGDVRRARRRSRSRSSCQGPFKPKEPTPGS